MAIASARNFQTEKPKNADDDILEVKAEQGEQFFVEGIENWRRSVGLEKMVLLGHSFGGYFAACYTMKSLGVGNLETLDNFLCCQDDRCQYSIWIIESRLESNVHSHKAPWSAIIRVREQASGISSDPLSENSSPCSLGKMFSYSIDALGTGSPLLP